MEQSHVDPVEQPVMFGELAEKKPANPLFTAVGLLSAAAGYFFLQMFELETRLHMYIGAGAGIVCGLVPFIIARMRGIQKLGLIAVLVCAVAGAIGGALLAGPIAIAFAVVAFRNN